MKLLITKKRATDAGVAGFISGHSLRVGGVACTGGCLGGGYAGGRQVEVVTDASTLRTRRDSRTGRNRKV